MSRDLSAEMVFGPLLTWWLSLEQALSRTPSRDDLKAEDLPTLALPHLVLCEFTYQRKDVIFHLIGDHIRIRSSKNWKGRLGSELADINHFNSYLLPLYQSVAVIRRPTKTVTRVQRNVTERFLVSRLILPLCGRDGRDEIDFILTAICFHRSDQGPINDEDLWQKINSVEERERHLY